MSLSSKNTSSFPVAHSNGRRVPLALISSLLLIEFLDEILDGVSGAALPLIRDDLRLTYSQLGLLLSVPVIFATAVEPVLGLLADAGKRRIIILTGGIAFTLCLTSVGLSHTFPALLVTYMVFYPAGGAFVSLSQTVLMDAEPERRAQNMARWGVAGSAGNALGPVLVAAAISYGASWRSLYFGMAAVSLFLVISVWRLPLQNFSLSHEDSPLDFRASARNAIAALRNRRVLRWLVLLECSDFTWDVMRGFLALYFVDVVGASAGEAALALVILTWVGLPGDLLLIPLLERVDGLRYLRWSVAGVLVLYPGFLIVPGVTAKLVLLGVLGIVNTGWYSILQAQLYAELPGRSGAVLALGNVSGLLHGLLPLILGGVAERFGLQAMMWILAIGPVVVLIGLLSRTNEL